MTTDTDDSLVSELRSLRLSFGINLASGLVGIGIGIASKTSAVMMDGVLAVLTAVMALFAIPVAKLLRVEESESFHFGHFAFEPLLNLLKGVVLLFVCFFYAIQSIKHFVHGGEHPDFGLALVYEIIAVLISVVVFALISREARRLRSPLLEVEAKEWLVDLAVGACIGAALLLGVFAEDIGLGWLSPYIDPTLTAIMAVGMAVVPLAIIRESFAQVIGMAPAQELQKLIVERHHGMMAKLGARRTRVRITQKGRTLYVHATIVLPPDYRPVDVAELDLLREKYAALFRDLAQIVVSDVILTKDQDLLRTQTLRHRFIREHVSVHVLPGSEAKSPSPGWF